MKNILSLFFFSLFFIPLFAQVGINTLTPKADLHINGSLQITNEFNVGGTGSVLGNSGEKGQVLLSNGSGNEPIWSTFKVPDLALSNAGTVIVVGGNFEVAQEISVQLAEDFNYNTLNTIVAIPNFSNVIIDNQNTYTSDATGNSFTVNEQGVYLISMNFLFQGATYNNNPVVGIWDSIDNDWLACVNDSFNVQPRSSSSNNKETYQSYTLITALTLIPGHTYSFRVADNKSFTIESTSSGSTGSGKVSMVTVKRLN